MTPWTVAFSTHGIFQARLLEWVAISFSRGSSRPRDGTCISCLACGFFTAEPPGKPLHISIDKTVYPQNCKLLGLLFQLIVVMRNYQCYTWWSNSFFSYNLPAFCFVLNLFHFLYLLCHFLGLIISVAHLANYNSLLNQSPCFSSVHFNLSCIFNTSTLVILKYNDVSL